MKGLLGWEIHLGPSMQKSMLPVWTLRESIISGFTVYCINMQRTVPEKYTEKYISRESKPTLLFLEPHLHQ